MHCRKHHSFIDSSDLIAIVLRTTTFTLRLRKHAMYLTQPDFTNNYSKIHNMHHTVTSSYHENKLRNCNYR